jgi:hypothetical protein
MFEEFVERSAAYYSEKVRRFGATPAGVDWNSAFSQELRFEQLTRSCPSDTSFSINDYGCGYGALARFLAGRGYNCEYRGIDVSADMIREATRYCADIRDSVFFSDRSKVAPADHTVASGIFNVKLDSPTDVWTNYVQRTLEDIDALSTTGFSFNMLTSYSDPDKMRTDLYYGDPCFFFDYCKKKFSSQVYLLHDYGLYEFTIGVRKAVVGNGKQ